MKAILNKLDAVNKTDGTRFIEMANEEFAKKPFEFNLQNTADEELYWIFLNEFLRDNSDLVLNHQGKISIRPNGYNPEQIICGIAPMWKEYESIEAFEKYYSISEFMRELFCNEKDENDNLAPIYIEIDKEKLIVTWENIDDKDIFNYRKATLAERGSLDILWDIFGGTVDKDNLKIINPCIGMVCGDIVSKGYGFNIVNTKSMCEHIRNLGYSIENVDFKYWVIN